MCQPLWAISWNVANHVIWSCLRSDNMQVLFFNWLLLNKWPEANVVTAARPCRRLGVVNHVASILATVQLATTRHITFPFQLKSSCFCIFAMWWLNIAIKENWKSSQTPKVMSKISKTSAAAPIFAFYSVANQAAHFTHIITWQPQGHVYLFRNLCGRIPWRKK